MYRHRRFLICLAVLVVSLAGLLAWGQLQRRELAGLSRQQAALVGRLQLTDLALWSEARYARHPSQADWFTPHQDFPGSLEHFPAGSLIAPAPVHPDTRIEVRHRPDPEAG